MRHVSGQRSDARRGLSESELLAAISYRGLVCPLLDDEISVWARKLGGAGAGHERWLQNLVTYWFAQALFIFRCALST